MIIWLFGISGAGKTTLGLKLKEYFEKNDKKVYMIDGDIVRDFYENDLGFSKEDRVANIKRILLSAHVLSENNVIAIVCNIFPFEFLREFARRKFNDYNQIYLKKDIEISRKDDVKGIYQDNVGKTAVVGVDLEFDEPACNELVVEVDNETEEESFAKILGFLKNKYTEIF